jgi:hypothetical protein
MHASQETLNAAWAARGLQPFGLGIGLSTGQRAVPGQDPGTTDSPALATSMSWV